MWELIPSRIQYKDVFFTDAGFQAQFPRIGEPEPPCKEFINAIAP